MDDSGEDVSIKIKHVHYSPGVGINLMRWHQVQKKGFDLYNEGSALVLERGLIKMRFGMQLEK